MSTRYSALDAAILRSIRDGRRDFELILRAVFWESRSATHGTRRSRDEAVGARLQALRKARRVEHVQGVGWRLVD